MPFAGNVRKNIGKNVSKNVSTKYSQKHFDYAKQCVAGTLKTALKRAKLKQLKVQKQLKVKQKIKDLIEQYQKKDIYLQKKRQQINK